jgi:hypothetical protein
MRHYRYSKGMALALAALFLLPDSFLIADTAARSRQRSVQIGAGLERIELGRESVAGVGSMSVFNLRQGDSKAGIRIESETDQSADAVEIDYAAGEIRGFGLTFRPEYDGSGAPVGLTVGNGSESVTVHPGQVEALSAADRSARARLNKNFNAANGPQRIREFERLLRAVQQQQSQHGRLRTNDMIGCIMNLVSIAVDWVSVIIACGAPVVDLLVCIPTIIWATADTIRSAAGIGNDC